MKFCKNHPDRPAVIGRRLCKECESQYRRDRQQKFYRNVSSDTLPNKEELRDLVNKKYTTESIAKRYLISKTTALKWLKDYDLKPYKFPTKSLINSFGELEREYAGLNKQGIVFLYDLFCTAIPKGRY